MLGQLYVLKCHNVYTVTNLGDATVFRSTHYLVMHKISFASKSIIDGIKRVPAIVICEVWNVFKKNNTRLQVVCKTYDLIEQVPAGILKTMLLTGHRK